MAMYVSIPNQIRVIKATEAVLDRIYAAAHKGLKGDSLALAAGLRPIEFRQLCELDPMAEIAALKGRADSELAHATKLAEASLNGDTKASLAILQHAHGWTAKQEVHVVSEHTVDIRTLLAERAERLIEGVAERVE